MEEERVVLETLFERNEIEFLYNGQVALGRWDCARVGLGQGLYLAVRITGRYPAIPAEVELSGPISSSILRELCGIGTTVAIRAAEANEVAVYSIYDAIRHQLNGQDTDDCAGSVQREICLSDVIDCFQYSMSSPIKHLAPKGLSLRFLLRFSKQSGITGFDKWSTAKTSECTGSVCGRLVATVTKERECTYVDLPAPMILDTEVQQATCFVSHAWKCPFASLVTALYGHQMGSESAWELVDGHVSIDRMISTLDTCLLKPEVKENYYWIDIFCKNQHIVESDETADELKRTVSSVAEIVLILNPLRDPIMLSRVWCLFEMFEALVCKVKITGLVSISCMLDLNNIIMKDRSLGAAVFHNKGKVPFQATKRERKGVESASSVAFTGCLKRVLDACDSAREEAVKNIDIQTAQATLQSDRSIILSKIESNLGIINMNLSVRQVADKCIRHWQAAALDSWAKSRKSGRWEAAATAIRRNTTS